MVPGPGGGGGLIREWEMPILSDGMFSLTGLSSFPGNLCVSALLLLPWLFGFVILLEFGRTLRDLECSE